MKCWNLQSQIIFLNYFSMLVEFENILLEIWKLVWEFWFIPINLSLFLKKVHLNRVDDRMSDELRYLVMWIWLSNIPPLLSSFFCLFNLPVFNLLKIISFSDEIVGMSSFNLYIDVLSQQPEEIYEEKSSVRNEERVEDLHVIPWLEDVWAVEEVSILKEFENKFR